MRQSALYVTYIFFPPEGVFQNRVSPVYFSNLVSKPTLASMLGQQQMPIPAHSIQMIQMSSVGHGTVCCPTLTMLRQKCFAFGLGNPPPTRCFLGWSQTQFFYQQTEIVFQQCKRRVAYVCPLQSLQYRKLHAVEVWKLFVSDIFIQGCNPFIRIYVVETHCFPAEYLFHAMQFQSLTMFLSFLFFPLLQIAEALLEITLPRFSGDILPKSEVGISLAVADR